MNSLKKLMMAALVTAVFGIASSTHAAPITFFGSDPGLGEFTRLPSHPNSDGARNQFFSNLIGVGTENFENFANGMPTPLVLNFVGAGTATLTGTGASVANVPTGTNGFGRYPISGNQYLETGQNFTINFSQPVAAFGFYATDIGDFDGQVRLSLLGLDGMTTILTVPNAINVPGGGVIYFGVIDTANPFTRITFGNTQAGTDFFGFDDMTIGSVQQVQPVPEPATMLLLATGLAGIAAKVGRRRRARKG